MLFLNVGRFHTPGLSLGRWRNILILVLTNFTGQSQPGSFAIISSTASVEVGSPANYGLERPT